ncbi:SLAM family member 9-like [Emydura macquarii macquarii]|uniref:SLAM family member 9-like n=1 Tax=Emydura macquarii macquarii TaxID=1129001 RepID=UPI00352B70E3
MAMPWRVYLTLLLFCKAGISKADAGATELSGILGGSVTFPLGIPAEQFKNAAWTVNTTESLVTVAAGTPPTVIVIEKNYEGRLGTPENSYSLQLTGLRMEDAGLYKAQVNTAKDKVTKHFMLRVYRQVPEPTIICRSKTCGNESCDYNLTCTVRDGGENVTYRWTQPEKGASVINESILLISREPQTAPWNLTCTAQNPVSTSSRTASAEDFCPANSPQPQAADRTWIPGIVALGSIAVIFIVIVGLWLLKNSRKRATQKLSPGAAGSAGADEESTTVYAQVGTFPLNGSRKGTQKRDPETKDDKTIYSTVHLPSQSPLQTDDEKLCKGGQGFLETGEKTVYSTVNQPTDAQETVVSKATNADESADTPRSKKGGNMTRSSNISRTRANRWIQTGRQGNKQYCQHDRPASPMLPLHRPQSSTLSSYFNCKLFGAGRSLFVLNLYSS